MFWLLFGLINEPQRIRRYLESCELPSRFQCAFSGASPLLHSVFISCLSCLSVFLPSVVSLYKLSIGLSQVGQKIPTAKKKYSIFNICITKQHKEQKFSRSKGFQKVQQAYFQGAQFEPRYFLDPLTPPKLFKSWPEMRDPFPNNLSLYGIVQKSETTLEQQLSNRSRSSNFFPPEK